MKGYVEVTLHSTDREAVQHTRYTLEQLPGDATLPRLVEEDGQFYVPEGFVAWAALHQGYVKTLVPVTEIITRVCGTRWCQKEGQDHSWDGPMVYTETSGSVTCSRCGIDAMSHDLMRLP